MRGTLTSASSTLLIEGKGIPTYKTVGLLFDGNKIDVEHVSATDSNSCGNIADGNFNAGNMNLGSLEKLRKIIKESNKKLPMNEVNATFNIDALVGFFVVKSADKLDLISQIIIPMLYFLVRAGKNSLPLMIYDPKRGIMEEQKITKELINEIFLSLDETRRQMFQNTLTNFR